MNLVKSFVNLIFGAVTIPGLPVEFTNALESFFGYFEYADGLIGLFFPIDIEPFFVVWAGIFGFEHGYPLIMWILRKIPMLGIKQGVYYESKFRPSLPCVDFYIISR